MGLLDGDIQAIVGGAFQDIFLDATYTAEVETESPASGATTTAQTNTACKAVLIDTPKRFKNSELWQEGSAEFLVLQSGFAVTPKVGDKVVFGGETFLIVEFDEDPASATWVIHGRR